MKTTEKKVHMAHCNQGEYEGSCKYGNKHCPVILEMFAERLEARLKNVKSGTIFSLAKLSAIAGVDMKGNKLVIAAIKKKLLRKHGLNLVFNRSENGYQILLHIKDGLWIHPH